MSLTQIIVLQYVAKFSGNARIGEPKFTPEIGARTFLHVSNEGITFDEKKLIFFR